MKAFNVVRFRVKPGFEQSFVQHHRNLAHGFLGFLGGSLFRTGEGTYCLTGEWRSYDDLVAARPRMIASLDQIRHMLEDLGGGLGVTDPVSGEVVASLVPTPGAPRATTRPAKKKPAKKKVTKRKAARKKATKKKATKKRATKKKTTSSRKKAKAPVRKKAKRKATRRRR